MIEEGVIDTSLWITQRLPIGDIPRRFDEVTRHEGLKAVVEVA